jgi:hypothetical protein
LDQAHVLFFLIRCTTVWSIVCQCLLWCDLFYEVHQMKTNLLDKWEETLQVLWWWMLIILVWRCSVCVVLVQIFAWLIWLWCSVFFPIDVQLEAACKHISPQNWK